MIAVTVDQDQVLEQVPIEIELDASGVGNTPILPKVVQTCQRHKNIRQNKCSKCLIQKSIKQH